MMGAGPIGVPGEEFRAARVQVDLDLTVPTKPRMRRVALILVVAVALLLPSAAVASHLFGDVPDSNPFHANISALAASGITAGCGGGDFCPKEAVTREQMAAFFQRGLGRVTRWDKAPQTFTENLNLINIVFNPGILQGTAGEVTQFIKADAAVTLSLTDATGCPCTYRAFLDELEGRLHSRDARVTLDAVGEYVTFPLTGAREIHESRNHFLRILLRRESGSGTASAYATITVEKFPFGGDGTHLLEL